MNLKKVLKIAFLLFLFAVITFMILGNGLTVRSIAIFNPIFAQEVQSEKDDTTTQENWMEAFFEAFFQERMSRINQIDKITYQRAVDKCIKSMGFEDIIDDFTRRKLYSLENVIDFPLVKKSDILLLSYGKEIMSPYRLFTVGVKKCEYLEEGDFRHLPGGNPRFASPDCAYFLEISYPDKECEFNEMIEIEDLEISTEEHALELVIAFIKLAVDAWGKIVFLDSSEDIKIYLSVSNRPDYPDPTDEKEYRFYWEGTAIHISQNELFKDWGKYKGDDSLYREIDKFKDIVHPPRVEADGSGNHHVTLFSWHVRFLTKWEFDVHRNGTLDWKSDILSENLY